MVHLNPGSSRVPLRREQLFCKANRLELLVQDGATPERVAFARGTAHDNTGLLRRRRETYLSQSKGEAAGRNPSARLVREKENQPANPPRASELGSLRAGGRLRGRPPGDATVPPCLPAWFCSASLERHMGSLSGPEEHLTAPRSKRTLLQRERRLSFGVSESSLERKPLWACQFLSPSFSRAGSPPRRRPLSGSQPSPPVDGEEAGVCARTMRWPSCRFLPLWQRRAMLRKPGQIGAAIDPSTEGVIFKRTWGARMFREEWQPMPGAL